MCEIKTHQSINKRLCGDCIELKNGYAKLRLKAIEDMIADEKGLIHGGFIFGLADYACMLAVNHPNVVLASSSFSFLKAVKLGDEMICEASITKQEGKKYYVEAIVKVDNTVVSKGEFLCIVPSKHVLDT